MAAAKKKKSGPSGPSKSYAERAEGAVAVMVWLNPTAAKRLDALCAELGASKRAVIERLLIGTLHIEPPPTPTKPVKKQPASSPVRPRAPEAPPAVVREATRARILPEPLPHVPGKMLPQPTPRSLRGLSPRELAERVRAGGARRDAIVLRTGERAGDRGQEHEEYGGTDE
jgi:hypothetical protein